MRISVGLVAFVIFALPSGARAGMTDADAIRDAASHFLNAYADEVRASGPDTDVRYSLGAIDSRLALAACSTPLEVSFNSDPLRNTRITLSVSCSEPQPWRMFLNTQIEILKPVMVAARPLPRGTRLTAQDAEAQIRIVNDQRHTPMMRAEDLEGLIVRRSLSAGTVLTADTLEIPPPVKRNDRVRIIATNGSVAVESWGIALADGQTGDQISVRNEQSQRTVRARVVGTGLVEIRF